MMSIRKKLLGALGLALMAAGIQVGTQLPANAQTLEVPTAEVEALAAQMPEEIEANSWTQPESLSAQGLLETEATSGQFVPVADEYATFQSEDLETADLETAEPVELAQARRRTRNSAAARRGGGNFVGIGADFGYADDVSFAVISKISLSQQVALRPSVLIGDNFSVLLPVTYEFSRFSTDVGSGFQIRPYAGVGASYVDGNDDNDSDDENFNVLLAAGADVPLSRRFTLNAQANLGLFNDTDFGVTVGVGYNFGGLGL